MAKKTVNKSSEMKGVVLGAGLAGLAATAYFFFGPKAKVNQKHAKAWAIKMKADVIEKLELAHEVSEPAYHKIIDTVAAKHAKGQKINSQDVKELAQDLKKHWQVLSKGPKTVKSNVAKDEKKVAKSTKK